MKLKMPKGYVEDPPDLEIERDVAELRRLLEGGGPQDEPHPAYWQNFLVRVRGRIDQDQVRRKRRSQLTAWASLTAAAVIAVVIVNDGLPNAGLQGTATDRSRNGGSVAAADAPAGSSKHAPLFAAEESAQSLVLSENDVKMVNAIVDGDDAAVFEAMVESEM